MKRIIFLAISVLGFVGCMLPDSRKVPKDFNDFKGWLYLDSTDRMSPEVWHLALKHSKSKLRVGPGIYDSVIVSMNLNYADSEMQMDFMLFKRQFAVDKQYMQTVRLRFDNDRAISVKFGSGEGTYNHVLVSANKVDSLVERMKTAKTMLVELMFDDHVKRIAEFDVTGLKWPYVAKNKRINNKTKNQ